MERESFELPARIGPRQVLALAWPVIVSMLSYTLMSTVDAVFVGRLGTGPLAAVGVAIPLQFLALAFGNGLLQGHRTLTAQRHGAGDHAAVDRLGFQTLWLAAGLGVLAWALLPVIVTIIGWLGAAPDVQTQAVAYVSARLVGAPLGWTLVGFTAWFQGRGDTRTPMIANVLANVVNCVLDPVFIFGWGPVPAYGAAGAAWSTVASIGVGAALLAWRFRAVARGPARLHRGLLSDVWRLGAPLGLSELFEVGAFAAFAAVLTRAGEIHLAAHFVVVRIVMVSFLPGMAVGNAAGVLVGQAVGARRPEAAWQAVRAALGLAIGFMLACGLAFLAVPHALLWVFGVEPAVAALGVQLLAIAAAFQLFDAVATVLYSALTGAGDTRFVMVTGVLAAWLVRLPIAWFLALPMGLGAPGAWHGFTVQIAVFAALAAWRVRSGRWLDASPVVARA